MSTVRRWTGHEARALRIALRFSVRAFAERLGIDPRTVSKWESAGRATYPRPDSQAMLDTMLGRADGDGQQRFELLCRSGSDRVGSRPRPQVWEYESWVDDLDRAMLALSGQDFTTTAHLVERWLARFSLGDLDDRGRYLYARTRVLESGARRDQGRVCAARESLVAARDVYLSLDIPRRVAQTDLGLVVLDEMSGSVELAARHYEHLSADGRLDDRDRALAKLWMGTALSKVDRSGAAEYAIAAMMSAGESFERLSETSDWSIAQQKLGLAHRSKGDFVRALEYIDIADRYKVVDSPLQHVRLRTARAHILISDTATRNEGMRVIRSARLVADKHGLQHQLDSIDKISSRGSLN